MQTGDQILVEVVQSAEPLRSVYILSITMVISTLMAACATNPTLRNDIPDGTWSPGRKYGITVPVFHFEDKPKKPDGNESEEEVNKVVSLKTGRVVAVLEQEIPAYDRALNHHGTGAALWSSDSSLLLWQVGGKWFADSLILLKIEDDKAKWQLDLMKAGQQAILERTNKADSKGTAAFKKSVTDAETAYQAKYPGPRERSAYPEGFTIDVRPDDNKRKQLTLPLKVQVDLTSNPKGIEGEVEVDSYLDGMVTKAGKFMVTDFKLGVRPLKGNDDRPSWR